MFLLGLIFLGVLLISAIRMLDDREEVRSYAKHGVITGAIGILIVSIVAVGPVLGIILFAVVVALSLMMQVRD